MLNPAERALRQAFLSRLPRRDNTRVLEVGCGTGIVARDVAALPGVVEVVGVDSCVSFVESARTLVGKTELLSFEVADGTNLPFADERFDVAVFATTLCHITDPAAALREAHRVVVPGGTLLVFDGDYATTTVALASDDPLQACVIAALSRLVHDPWLVRRLRPLVSVAGFTGLDLESHGYVETEAATYMPTVIAFGADALVSEGQLGAPAAEALKSEAHRRIEAGSFFGHIAYASLLATRPAL